ncbi:serine C-palmitoyltransferase [Entamoeba marina]
MCPSFYCAFVDAYRGIVEHLGCNFNDVAVLMGTFSKSFASTGGYIASDKQTIKLLKYNCYYYIYGTPMLPAYAGCNVLGDDDSPVIPVLIYNTVKMEVILINYLKGRIAFVVVKFPGCPVNACRIRFCISAKIIPKTNTVFHFAPSGDLIHHVNKIDIEMLKQLPKNPRKMLPLGESTLDISICNKLLKLSGIEISSYDIHNFSNDDEEIKQQINNTMTFGCGSCGQRNFYGTTIEQLLLENQLVKYFCTLESVLHSYSNNTLTSTVTLYSKANDVLLVDEKCKNDKVVVIVDDTLGISDIGSGLRGPVEHLGILINEVYILCGSLETSFKNIQIIGGDTTPYVLLNTNGNNSKLRQYLLENGYCTVLQQHLIGDWCTNDYVRLCINNQLTNGQLFDFVNVFEQY